MLQNGNWFQKLRALATSCHVGFHATQTAAGQYIPVVTEIINIQNIPEEIVIYRFGKHGKKADGWKPATVC